MHTLRTSIRNIEKQFEPGNSGNPGNPGNPGNTGNPSKRPNRFRSSHPPPLATSSAFSSRKPRQSSEPGSSDALKTPILRKLSPPHTLTTFSNKRSLPPASSDEKRQRTESSEGLRTPPRVAKPALSLRDYAQIEKERNFDAYKQRERSVMQSLPSLDDLQLPKLPSRNGTKLERREGVGTQSTSQESKESVKTHKQVGVRKVE